ncbi:hypothetical protein ABVK25_008597 [Lepraria finkii]|uniref:Uncharacterized protein n=1 Tax=Lepraria finkii TaxID=1340010 RepID=A0ABR4B1A0_9LECA
MFLYHATIIIHDMFNTERDDRNISTSSSYLEYARLYGSNQVEQESERLGKDGLLKPDTFHEDRLLGQPPGFNVLLVLYSRFHNYVATVLKEINEDGRFTGQTLKLKIPQRSPAIPRKSSITTSSRPLD